MKKRLFAVILVVCLIFGMMPAVVSAKSGEHVINTADDWAAFADYIANGEYTGDTWKLGADIGVSLDVSTQNYYDFATVGTEEHPFSGTFDGQGHTLNVNIKDTYWLNEQSNPGVAPFRFISGATIRNLTVSGSVTGPGHSAGLVSYNKSGSSMIENCFVYADVSRETGNNQRSGGVLGYNMAPSVTIRNVVYGGTLINSEYNHNIAGGLIGWSDKSSVTLDNCIFNGSCTGKVEAFSPILIENPQIDDVNHNGINASFSDVYYTVEPSEKWDEHVIGSYFINDTVSRFVCAGIPENAVYEYIKGPDGCDYHRPCTVEGLQNNYMENEDWFFTVRDCEGRELEDDSDYVWLLKRDGTNVTRIRGEGTYLLTIRGKGKYTGTFTKTMKVYDSVPYKTTDGSTKTVSSYLPVTNETDSLTCNSLQNRGWYVVFGDITVNNNISVNGDVNLVLCDGATLNANAGIGVGQGCSLTIWVQSEGTGKIISTGTPYCAGIGSGDTKNGGSVTINGGIITARGGSGTSGIGGGEGSVTINGGSVTAYGGSSGAGIGGGSAVGAGNITINGGTVTAYGGDCAAAGIGGGCLAGGGSISINGGTVRAYGGELEEGLPTLRRVDIGVHRKDAVITLDYTDESAKDMSVSAEYWVSPVNIKKPFFDRETLEKFNVTDVADNSALSKKTLIPASEVVTVAFDPGDGTGEMEDVYLLKGSEYTLPECEFAVPSEKRTFVCWKVKIGDDSPVMKAAGSSVAVTKDTVLTAMFRSEYATLQNLIDDTEDGGEIVLSQDYISEKETDTVFVIPQGKKITIDLNGHTIDRRAAVAASDGNIFNVSGTLTVKDSGTEGTIKGGNKNSSGGAFYVPEGGTLIIEGCNITGNHAVNGGAVYTVGTVIMKDGSVTGNTADKSGGGVFVSKNGTFALSGGEITDNTAASGYHGGGVHMAGTMYVSDNPVVRSNKRGGEENNVGLYNGALITVAGELTEGASIGVNKSKANSSDSEMGVITSGLNGNGDFRAFTADSEGQHVLPNESKEAAFYAPDIYYIDIEIIGHGKVTVDSLYAKKGDRLGFETYSDSGYRRRSFNVKDDAGNNVNVSYGNKLWVYMPDSNITVTAVFDPYYLISVDKNTPYGSIDLEWVWSYVGVKVPLSATPDRNCRQVKWVVTDANGDFVETADGGFIMPESDVTVSAVFEPVPNPEGPVAYVNENGDEMTPVSSYTVIDPNTNMNKKGWYVVKDNVGIGRQIIYEDVNLILCNGVTLTVNNGIIIDNGASLTIWQQKEGTGGLRVENIRIESAPAIEGYRNASLTINGGNIYAEGYKSGERFDDPSGGSGIYANNLVINGGNIEAKGGWRAAGIGGNKITINGGNIKATGGANAAGIGGGLNGNGGTITINGGTVDAVSGGGSAGIGAGAYGNGGNITINGGTVLASGYDGGAGIGGGRYGAGGNIVINGGNVRAYSYYRNKEPSYGIGAGSGSSEANITLSWTNENDSIFANSYGGKVTLIKQFIDDEGIYHGVCELINGSSQLYPDINGKTLRPVTKEISNEGGNEGDDEADYNGGIYPNQPQTGDNNRLALWFTVMAASMIFLAALTASRRRYALSAKRK